MTRVLAVLAVLVIAALGLQLEWGWEYYRLPSIERPLHPLHSDLRSSGRLGLAFGTAGAGLLLLNLTYLLRKRFVRTSWLGNLRTWMGVHVFTGVAGAAFAVAHSALRPTSVLGQLALLALAVVVVVGLVGRYVYSRVPRSMRGRELESAELQQRLEDYRTQLQALGVGGLMARGSAEIHDAGRASTLGRLVGLIAGDRDSRRAYRSIRRALAGHADRARILPIARRVCKDQQGLARYGELRGLMGSWRFLHRWLAVMMLIVLAFHVGLALRFGGLL